MSRRRERRFTHRTKNYRVTSNWQGTQTLERWGWKYHGTWFPQWCRVQRPTPVLQAAADQALGVSK